MTSALVNASLSLREWQAVKMIFLATCLEDFDLNHHLRIKKFYILYSY